MLASFIVGRLLQETLKETTLPFTSFTPFTPGGTEETGQKAGGAKASSWGSEGSDGGDGGDSGDSGDSGDDCRDDVRVFSAFARVALVGLGSDKLKERCGGIEMLGMALEQVRRHERMNE